MRNKSYCWAAAAAGVMLLCVFLLAAPPRSFPLGKVVVIAQGAGVAEVASDLAEAHIIAHATALKLLLRLTGEGRVQAGSYRFSKPENLFNIAHRLQIGDYQIPPAKITFVEGTTVREAATLVASALPEISVADFIKKGSAYEGYLFPDTYLFVPGADATTVITTMRENFNKKIAPLEADIATSSHRLSDIVTMASLLEKEARTTETKRVIAGILWHRLALHMPLQVDAVFGYIFNKPTYSPSFADLKVESPYNTYTHQGLPPTPINNPGLDSIEAALHPTVTNYLYYLVDRNGVIHYAATYAGHQVNQAKYLP